MPKTRPASYFKRLAKRRRSRESKCVSADILQRYSVAHLRTLEPDFKGELPNKQQEPELTVSIDAETSVEVQVPRDFQLGRWEWQTSGHLREPYEATGRVGGTGEWHYSRTSWKTGEKTEDQIADSNHSDHAVDARGCPEAVTARRRGELRVGALGFRRGTTSLFEILFFCLFVFFRIFFS